MANELDEASRDISLRDRGRRIRQFLAQHKALRRLQRQSREQEIDDSGTQDHHAHDAVSTCEYARRAQDGQHTQGLVLRAAEMGDTPSLSR